MKHVPRDSGGTTFRQFAGAFWRAFRAVSRVLLAIFSVHLILAWLFSRVEELDFGRSLYFASITGFTVGYGDIVPTTSAGRVIAVGLSFIGVVFVGLIVAIATSALNQAMKETSSPAADR